MQPSNHEYASWDAELQELKQRILSYQSFIDQSGPRVSTHPSPASRLLTDLVVWMKECARKIDMLQEAMMADITEMNLKQVAFKTSSAHASKSWWLPCLCALLWCLTCCVVGAAAANAPGVLC